MNGNAQLTLPFSLSEETLRDRLQDATCKEVFLTITDNSSSIISAKTRDGILHVRLHHMFLLSDDYLISELAAFIRGRKAKTPLIRDFLGSHSGLLKRREPRAACINPKGKHHDLAFLARSVNCDYFGGKITAPVTWGARRSRRAARHRTLGSYSSHTHTIRINPVLDRKRVPSYFIEFIIYHEMLHADMGVDSGMGRRSVHTPEFRRRERMFRKYSEALAWERRMNFSL